MALGLKVFAYPVPYNGRVEQIDVRVPANMCDATVYIQIWKYPYPGFEDATAIRTPLKVDIPAGAFNQTFRVRPKQPVVFKKGDGMLVYVNTQAAREGASITPLVAVHFKKDEKKRHR